MELPRLWQLVLERMRERIGHIDVSIWLETARPLSISPPTQLNLRVPNRYYADWIREHYVAELKELLTEILGREIDVLLSVDEAGTEGSTGASGASGETVPPPPEGVKARASGVNHGQTFESFVVGECNRFAHAAASAVAEELDTKYNPLFIYGATGLGKTHLMHAIANRVLAEQPDSRVVYVTSEDFTNELITFLRYRRMDDFRAKYRERATVLLVDDVQFLSGRERTQEEFFHTFNALKASGRQIVLTSDVEPKDIAKLEPRLRTRFEGGLLADMQAPDRETLLAILQQKAESRHLQVPPNLAEAIASRVEGNIRELEGILNRILAQHTFHSEPVSLEWARRRLPGVFDPPAPTVTVSAIIEAVAGYHNLRSADITGKRRTRNLTRPRQIAMYLSRLHTGMSFPELGREFGGRDHSTIQHGCRRVQEEIESDADLAYKVRLIEQSLGLRQRRI